MCDCTAPLCKECQAKEEREWDALESDRDALRARVAELEAYQRNAGIWMAELIEKIDRYEGALRRVSVPVGESTLDARIAIATNALTA